MNRQTLGLGLGLGLGLEQLQVKAFGVHFLPNLQIKSGLRVVSLRHIDERAWMDGWNLIYSIQ